MTAEAAARIESQVRDQIRERGVDPVREADAVRALVEEALEAWDERALVGAVAPVTDREGTAKSVVDNVSGLGPLQRYLDDPEIEEIGCCNHLALDTSADMHGPISRYGRYASRMTPKQVAQIIESRGNPVFVERLRDADAEFGCVEFEAEVAAFLRREPVLLMAWASWSEDQRWTPSAYFTGATSGWVTDGGTILFGRQHRDEAAAAANLIRRLAAWMCRRSVLYSD